MMKKDELFEIFISNLHEVPPMDMGSEECDVRKGSRMKYRVPTETAQDFIKRVSNIYAMSLMRHGFMPMHFFEDIMHDIESEVVEMYRKKTYGFLTLHDYRKEFFKKKK